jgi:TM2 domain-containing membrane protein YozV
MSDSSGIPATASAPHISDAARLMQYDATKKSVGVAYLLWFFLGWFGAHRFYLGETGTGVAMAIITVISFFLSFVGIGLLGLAVIGIWVLVDAFLIPGIAMRKNQALATQIGMR